MLRHIYGPATLIVFIWNLSFTCLAEAQGTTIYWKKDHIYNGASGKEIAVVTPLPTDQTSPTAPTGLTSPGMTATSIQLSWTASTDAGGSGLAGFKIYRQRSSEASLPVGSVGAGTTTFTDQHVEANTNYTFAIVAFDNAQNHSGPSNFITLTRGPDTTSPSVPSQVVATATTTTQVSLTWTPSTDNVGVAHYRIDRRFNSGSYVQIAISTTANHTDATAAAGITYLYRVRAVDALGNTSGYSNADLATTVIFADNPPTIGVTSIKAQHFTELRQAVNAVRATAGLAAATWTDATLTGVTIRAIHVQEIRSSLGTARTALGFTTAGYTDPYVELRRHIS